MGTHTGRCLDGPFDRGEGLDIAAVRPKIARSAQRAAERCSASQLSRGSPGSRASAHDAGALVFCAPSQNRAAQRLMVGRDLRRRHVLVAESLEYLIEAALLSIPCRRRPSRRRSRNIIGPLPAALVTATSRSFLGVLPRELDWLWCNRHPLRPIVLADPDASYQPINCTVF